MWGGKYLLRRRNRRQLPPTRHDQSYRNRFTSIFYCSRRTVDIIAIFHDNTLSRKAFHICLRRDHTVSAATIHALSRKHSTFMFSTAIPLFYAATFRDAEPSCAHGNTICSTDHCWCADSTPTPQLPTIITTCDTDSISTPQRPTDHKACSADGTSTHTEPHPADMITHD